MSSNPNVEPITPTMKGGPWDFREHQLFLQALHDYPIECKNRWKLIAQLVQTRTSTQVRTHAQKFFKRMKPKNGSALMRSRYRSRSNSSIDYNPTFLEKSLTIDENSSTIGEFTVLSNQLESPHHGHVPMLNRLKRSVTLDSDYDVPEWMTSTQETARSLSVDASVDFELNFTQFSITEIEFLVDNLLSNQ